MLAEGIDLPPLTASLVFDPVGRRFERESRDAVDRVGFIPREAGSLKDEFQRTSAGLIAASNRILATCYEAAPARRAEEYVDELVTEVAKCTTDDEVDALTRRFAQRIASAALDLPFEGSLDPEELGFLPHEKP